MERVCPRQHNQWCKRGRACTKAGRRRRRCLLSRLGDLSHAPGSGLLSAPSCRQAALTPQYGTCWQYQPKVRDRTCIGLHRIEMTVASFDAPCLPSMPAALCRCLGQWRTPALNCATIRSPALFHPLTLRADGPLGQPFSAGLHEIVLQNTSQVAQQRHRPRLSRFWRFCLEPRIGEPIVGAGLLPVGS